MEPLKQKINVVDGLFNKASTGLGIHPAQTGSLLSGAQVSKGAILHSGMSVDQMIANTIGQDTAQSSIVLACDPPMTGYHETNYSMAYSSHVSWQSPDSPVPVELYPSLAFDNLFENRGTLRNISIIDRVKESAEAMSRRSAPPTRASWTNTSPACAKSRNVSTGCARAKMRPRTQAKTEEHRRCHDGAAGERLAGRFAGTREADVRHYRHRLPDR